jgi:hypothetical protein
MRQVLALLAMCANRVPALHLKNSREPHDLPSYGKVAILVRGQSYRGEDGVCSSDDFVKERQEYATSSFMEKILNPLRNDLHNQVDIVVTDSADCKLTAGLVTMMGGSSVVQGVRQFDKTNQALSMQESIRSLEDVLGGVSAISKYDLVLIVRHDVRWGNEALITMWPADFSLFNFPDTCPPSQTDPECTSDIFHTMPGKFYPAYRSVIMNNSATRCFDACEVKDPDVLCHQNGHHCFPSIRDAVAKLQGNCGLIFRDGIPGDGKERVMDSKCGLIPMSDNDDRAVEKLKQCCEETPNAGCCTGPVADAVRKKYGVENIQPSSK